MATLQKFKLLATQCAVISSPTPSPTTSPIIHIRRRKTLRMLLRRTSSTDTFLRRHKSDKQPSQTTTTATPTTTTTKNHLNVRLKLKDLFISSPPPPITDKKVRQGEESKRLFPVSDAGELTVARPIGGGSVRPLSATLRQRLLMRKIWRPALVAIPEQSP